MAESLLVYDSNGDLQVIVHFNANETPNLNDPAFSRPGGETISLTRAEYDTYPAPVNINGKAHHIELDRNVLAKFTNPSVAAKIAAKIKSHDDAVAAEQAALSAAIAAAKAP